MTFAITNLTGDFGTTGATAGFTMTFGNFSASGGGESFSLNGDMTITASSTATETTATISGDIFTMSFTSGGATNSMQLTAYNETYTETNTGAFNYSVDMTLAGTAMGGSVIIATTTPFTGNTGLNSGNPTAGVMTISGASGSSLTISANATDVTYFGTDGTTPFGPTTVAWTAL
jgi:cytoskeletal protein RodZ